MIHLRNDTKLAMKKVETKWIPKLWRMLNTSVQELVRMRTLGRDTEEIDTDLMLRVDLGLLFLGKEIIATELPGSSD